MIENYKTIVLCGSTRREEDYIQLQKKLTLEGNIVISIGVFGNSGDYGVFDDLAEERAYNGQRHAK